MSSFVCAGAGPYTASERLDAVVRYWMWTNYWGPAGIDFPGSRYIGGRTMDAVVFWETDITDREGVMWGFCSRMRGLCQAYVADADGVVLIARGLRMKAAESETEAFNRFRMQDFSDDGSVVPCEPLVSRSGEGDRQQLTGLVLGQEGTVCKAMLDVGHFHVQRSKIRLPMLTVPEAAARRFKNLRVEAMVASWGSVPERKVLGCSGVVPFADERVPFVPVLSVCSDSTTVLLVRRQLGIWTASAGGMVRGREAERLKRRILAHASLTLKN